MKLHLSALLLTALTLLPCPSVASDAGDAADIVHDLSGAVADGGQDPSKDFPLFVKFLKSVGSSVMKKKPQSLDDLLADDQLVTDAAGGVVLSSMGFPWLVPLVDFIRIASGDPTDLLRDFIHYHTNMMNHKENNAGPWWNIEEHWRYTWFGWVDGVFGAENICNDIRKIDQVIKDFVKSHDGKTSDAQQHENQTPQQSDSHDVPQKHQQNDQKPQQNQQKPQQNEQKPQQNPQQKGQQKSQQNGQTPQQKSQGMQKPQPKPQDFQKPQQKPQDFQKPHQNVSQEEQKP